jgi:DNA-directed RNA polymerase subunit omega
MMLHLLDDLPEDIDSKYRLVIIAAKRSKQLHRGAQPLTTSKALKPASIALDEIFAKKVKFEVPLPDAAACQVRPAEQEVRGAWFRHIPPEELISEEHLPAEEEKVVAEGFEVEAEAEEFQPELEEQAGGLEEGIEEFAPLSEVPLEEEIGKIDIESGGEGEE